MSAPAEAARIIQISLDQRTIVRWSPEVEHERNVAIFDILEENRFALKDAFEGPYKLELSLRDATLVFGISNDESERRTDIPLPVKPLRRIIKDYFLICESYFNAIKGATPSKIESIDMARRGLHNEGAEILAEALADKVDLDTDTARRLFTLVCVLHFRG